MKNPQFDPGSFRDPEGQVFFYNNQVYRTLKNGAVSRIENLLALDFFKAWEKEGQLIKTKLVKSDTLFPSDLKTTPFVLMHEKVPFISYPFEWSFTMLKEAALLTLDLMEELLKNNYILKDGTAWNICFYEGKPCFYDILSIDAYEEGQPWEGFSQFLQEFLYPLMIKSHLGLEFQALWASTLQGIPVDLANNLLRKKFILKKGVFKYVYLQGKLSTSKTVQSATVRQEFSSQSFPKSALNHIIRKLRTCIESLHSKTDHSVWKDYAENNSYEDADTREKKAFIQEGLRLLQPKTVIDLGCNTGQYSLIAAQNSQVISCDLDATCIDRLYLTRNKNISPIVLNLMNPTPSMGWFLKERKSIFERVNADSFMALALIHHLCISFNVPLSSFVQFLKSVSSRGIVEWVDKADPMVQFLLRNRKDIFSEYTWENFESLISEAFVIEKVIQLNKGTRKLVLLSGGKIDQ